MFTGLQGQKILYTTSFVGKVCRKILVSIRAKLLECLGWLCMTLHLSFPSMYKARYKSTFWKTKLLGLAHRNSLVTQCFFFFFALSPSLSFSGWSSGVQSLSLFTFLPGLLRSSWEGSLHFHPIERMPEAFVNRANPVQGLYWLSL